MRNIDVLDSLKARSLGNNIFIIQLCPAAIFGVTSPEIQHVYCEIKDTENLTVYIFYDVM